MKGIFVGSIHQVGTSKDGRPYDFYSTHFEIPMPDTGFGKNFLHANINQAFPELTPDNIGKTFEIYSYVNNGRTYINGVHLCNE